jgi:hypothetical protein
MRRTLTLDEDVDLALMGAARETGKTFKEVVNKALRDGLAARERRSTAPELKIKPLSMGLREGLSLTSVSHLESLLEEDGR